MIDNKNDNHAVCTVIRNQKTEIRSKNAEIAFLKTQLNATNRKIDAQEEKKKRKRVKSTEDGNSKLVRYEAVLGTQEAVRLEQEEEDAREERRRKRARRNA